MGGRPRFPVLEVFGFQSRDGRVQNLFRSLSCSLEHTHRDTGRGAGHRHMDGTQVPTGTALRGGAPGRWLTPAPPCVSFYSLWGAVGRG